jgi:hypothetical protein
LVKSSVGEVTVGEAIFGEVTHTHTLIKYQRTITLINKRNFAAKLLMCLLLKAKVKGK